MSFVFVAVAVVAGAEALMGGEREGREGREDKSGVYPQKAATGIRNLFVFCLALSFPMLKNRLRVHMQVLG